MIRRRYFLLACAALTLSACSAAVQTPALPAFTSDQISVTTRGSGPDIILIHGLAGHPGVWAESAESLDDRYRLHLVQINGFGGATRTSTDTLVSVAVAREIARYIREAALTRPALIGHSMGGTIAMMVAAQNPGLTGRVMVVDMVPFMGAMFGQPNATAASLQPMADLIRGQLLTGDMLNMMVTSMARSEANRQKLAQYAGASDRRTVANAMYELIVTDLRPQLGAINVPLTVLYVQPPNVQVPAAQFDAGMRQNYSGVAGVTMVRVDESNHYIMMDQPVRFVAEVDAFMRRTGKP